MTVVLSVARVVALAAVVALNGCVERQADPADVPDPDNLVLVVLTQLLDEGLPNQPTVACVETYDSGVGGWKDASPELLSRLTEEGRSVAPGSACTLRAFAEAEAGSGWVHAPSGRSAERYQARVLYASADSADLALVWTFSINSLGCRFRIRRVGGGWKSELLDPPCASGHRWR